MEGIKLVKISATPRINTKSRTAVASRPPRRGPVPCGGAACRDAGRRTQQGYSPGSRRRAPHRLAGVAAILTVARTVTRQLIYQVSSVLCCRRGMNGNSPHLLPSYLCSHSSCACIPCRLSGHCTPPNSTSLEISLARCQIIIIPVLPPLHIILCYDFLSCSLGVAFCLTSSYNR